LFGRSCPPGGARSTKRNRAAEELEGGDAAGAQDAAALTLRAAAPHTVIDAVGERVLEAFGLHRAFGAHTLRDFDTDAVGREELPGGQGAAASMVHPRRSVVVGGGQRVVHGVFNGGRVDRVPSHGWIP